MPIWTLDPWELTECTHDTHIAHTRIQASISIIRINLSNRDSSFGKHPELGSYYARLKKKSSPTWVDNPIGLYKGLQLVELAINLINHTIKVTKKAHTFDAIP